MGQGRYGSEPACSRQGRARYGRYAGRGAPHAAAVAAAAASLPDRSDRSIFGRVDGIMVSGGVGEYVYGRETRDFGDMGLRLGAAIRTRVDAGALPWPLLPAGECIRATALGASEYRVQLSGNTSTISDPGELLPRRNLQVWQRATCARRSSTPTSSRGHPRPFHRLRSVEGETEVALALRWLGVPSLRAHRGFAQGIRHGLATDRRRKPLYIMLDGDIAQTLGADPTRGARRWRARSWPSMAWCCGISIISISAAFACPR